MFSVIVCFDDKRFICVDSETLDVKLIEDFHKATFFSSDYSSECDLFLEKSRDAYKDYKFCIGSVSSVLVHHENLFNKHLSIGDLYND